MSKQFANGRPAFRLPSHIPWLAVLYCIASLLHFSHNAEYISYYPNMPSWLTREHVYLVWAAVTSVGVAALLLHRFGWPLASVICLAVYGSFGFDALGHYSLARCSQHTLAQNLMIWFEVAAGAGLLSSCIAYLVSRRGHAS
ncbi:MAG: hypothetical protein ACO1NO_11450 [Burkholderiaceae bacterium]